MAGTFINQNLKLGDIIFHCNKIGDCALRGIKFQVNISPCVFNGYITKCKVEWTFDEGSVVSFTPQPFYTWRRALNTHWIRGFVGLRACVDSLGDINHFLPPGMKIRSF
jgi:hypothetical protein